MLGDFPDQDGFDMLKFANEFSEIARPSESRGDNDGSSLSSESNSNLSDPVPT